MDNSMCDRRVLCVVLTGMAAAAQTSLSTELTVKNDSVNNPSGGTPCHCLISGESAAAWLTAPATGDIVAVQILWKSTFGGAPDSQEASITIFDGSSFPTPGAALTNQGGGSAVIVTPTLTDGVFNEFRFLDQAQTVPLSVPVSSGQVFVVSLELINSNSGNQFLPSVTYDGDGCQTGLNAVDVQSGGWTDACTLGVGGDWVIRAVVDSSAPIPATSDWGLIVSALLLVSTGSVLLRRSRVRQTL